jgi:hypothetical protein
MTPSTLLAVDGSARTLTWVDVMPPTMAMVAGGGGSGVREEQALAMRKSGCVSVGRWWASFLHVLELQLVLRSVNERKVATIEWT